MGKTRKLIRTVPLIRVPEHEWGKLLLSLRQSGYTKRAIIDWLDISEFLYEKILRDHKEPTHHVGELILKLNERITGNDSKHSHRNLSQELS